MNHGTTTNDPTQDNPQVHVHATYMDDPDTPCSTFTWCEAGDKPHSYHHGDADMAPITATADRTHTAGHDSGVIVPQILVDLVADADLDPEPLTHVVLAIHAPDQEPISVEMTLDEADYLRRHLVQLLRNARKDGTL